MQTILETYFQEKQLSVECYVGDEGRFISVLFQLEEKEWAKNTITLEGNKMIVQVWNSLGNTTWDIIQRHQKGVSKAMEDVFSHMLRFWGFLIRQNEDIQLLLLNVDPTNFGSEAFGLLKKNQFMILNSAQEAFIHGHYGHKINWLGRLEVEADDVTKSLTIATQIEMLLQQKQKEDPTMESQWAYEKRTLDLSYRGVEATIHTSVSSEGLTLTLFEKEYVMSNEESVQGVLGDIFIIFEENETPSTKHYDAFMKHVLVRKSFIEAIYQRLLERYTWMDIETFAAKKNQQVEEAKKAVLYNEELKLFRYLGHFFVLDYDTGDLFVYEEKEQALAYFKEHVLKNKERKLEEQMKTFSQDANAVS